MVAARSSCIVIDFIADPQETAGLIAKVVAAGGPALGVQADVSQHADLQTMIQKAVHPYGLINIAGIETRTSLLDTNEADFDKVVAVKMKSAFCGTQATAQQFTAQSSAGF